MEIVNDFVFSLHFFKKNYALLGSLGQLRHQSCIFVSPVSFSLKQSCQVNANHQDPERHKNV